MNTLTATRPPDKRSDVDAIGGVAAAHSKAPTQDTMTQFERALAEWTHCRHDLDHAPLDLSKKERDRLYDLLGSAEARLLALNPQNINQLRAMSEVIWGSTDVLPTREAVEAHFRALRHLDSSHTISPTFDPEAWLAMYERNGGGWVEVGGEITLVSPTPQSERMQEAFWLLETRGSFECVKAAIRARSDERAKTTWGKALSDYQAAAAKLREHSDQADPSLKLGTPENDAYEAKTDALADAAGRAIEALFACPSPDLEAFRYKTRLFAREELAGWHCAQSFAEVIANEAQRLAN